MAKTGRLAGDNPHGGGRRLSPGVGLLNRKGFDLENLHEISQRPRLWEPGDAVFWKDPYIAQHVLEAHLNPKTEQASRPPKTIDQSVSWIVDRLGLARGQRLLDIACGPGLYCTRFARRGLDVVGIDYSEVSIDYARKNHPDVRFLLSDYRDLDFEREFDVITLIYGDFCVLSDRDRKSLLQRIRAALRPGGHLVFDVFTEYYVLREGFDSDWYVNLSGGFWSPEPHLVLEQTLHYPRRQVAVDRYIVVDQAGSVTRYHIWKHYYTPRSITSVLGSAHFEVEGLYGDLEGTPYEPDAEWIGVIAKSG